MANGGMWPMRQSDRGGLLVSGIEEVPAGAAAIGAAEAMRSAIEHDAAEALKRAKAKIDAAGPDSVTRLTTGEMAAIMNKNDQPASSALERADAKIRATKPGEIANLEDDEIRAVCATLRIPRDVLPPSDPPPAEPSSEARSALATAADVVQHRRAAYGSPKENFQRIADFWTIALRDKLTPGETVTLTDVAQMMRLVKEARLIETPDHFDSLVDICGYVDCQQRVLP